MSPSASRGHEHLTRGTMPRAHRRREHPPARRSRRIADRIARRPRAILEPVAATDTDRLNAEFQTLVTGCGLVDRSKRGKLALTGPGAVEFLDGQVTNELAGLRPGEGRYAAFLTHKGKMLGDLRILVVETPALPAETGQGWAGDESGGPPSELLLDTERVALQALFDMIRRYKIGYDVALHKRTLECALLSLIGPTAREVAARALDPKLALPRAEHAHLGGEIAGLPVRLVSTDEGVDVLCDADDAEAVRARLLDVGAQAVGEPAAEVVRVERGRPRYGVDIDASTIPQEAGLNERAVSFTKGCYVGQETVARLFYKGKPNRHLRGLRLSAPAAPGEELRLGERPVGRLGSAVLSPALGPIGLALVRREAQPQDTVAVGAHGVTAAVVELPFGS
jgi:tRNA-modifying protein YgfZ